MASPFAEAIMQSMVASMDPTIAMQRDAMQGYLAQQKNVLALEKAKTVKEIAELLNTAVKDNADPAVIRTYKELLESLTA